MKRKTEYTLGILAILVQLFMGCTRDGIIPPESGDLISLPFSFSVSQASSPQTKMTDAIVQASNPIVFRGIEQVHMIPFKVEGEAVVSSDVRWGGNLSLPQIGLPANTFGDDADGGSFEGLVSISNSHLYDNVSIRRETNAVLVYGKALDESVGEEEVSALKSHNGVLDHPNLSGIESASEIIFSPEPFLGTASDRTSYTTWRTNLVDKYLNPIINASATNKNVKPNVTYRFHTPSGYLNNPVLVGALEAFTNEGRLMSGSYDVLNKKLTDLYRAIYPLSIDRHNSLGYNVGTYYYVYELARDIISKINKSDYVSITGSGTNAKVSLLIQAPGSFGLPHGAFPLQYREGSKAFGQTLNASTGMSTVDAQDFCYPPALWYFTNSRLRTSSDESVIDYYKSDTGTWGSILSHYGSSFVQSDSKAAAVKESLQYGVGRLIIRINKTENTTIQDYSGTGINVSNKNKNIFPLTGIVIADQKPVDFCFHPLSGDTDSYYVYDTDVNDGSSPKAYISHDTASKAISVLVLETPEEQDVHFALEFVNSTNSTLYGLNNAAIYPGNHFYLAGVLRFSEAENNSGEDISSVFCQDRTTEVAITISSLENALTVLPELREPQLLLGVDARMNWDMVTPGTVPIK